MKKWFWVLAAVLALTLMCVSASAECSHSLRVGTYTEIAPTCTEPGYMVGPCMKCGENVRLESRTKRPLGHSYGEWEIITEANCSVEGEKKCVCQRCGDVMIEKVEKNAEHTFGSWEIAAQATDSDCGIEVRVCTLCGAKERRSYYPEGTLFYDLGDADSVRKLASSLTALGFAANAEDGVYTAELENAVKDFQKAHGLSGAGVAFPETLRVVNEEMDSLNANNLTGCRYTDHGDGTVEVVFCAKHEAIANASSVLLVAAPEGAGKQAAIAQVRALWEGELEALFTEWESLLDEKTIVTVTRSMFTMFLNSQEAAWKAQAAEGDIAPQMNAISAIQNECALICSYVDEIKTDK